MSQPVPLVAALTAAVLAFGVPAAVAAENVPDAKPAPRTYQVAQKFTQFNPSELKIKPGDTVVWTNMETDGTTHSVVQSNGSEINSPDITPGQHFTWTFDFPGEWDIVCRFHPAMFQTIKVVGKAVRGAKRPEQQQETQAPPAAPPTEPDGSTIPGVTGLPIGVHPRAHG
jgi:plastocyanin